MTMTLSFRHCYVYCRALLGGKFDFLPWANYYMEQIFFFHHVLLLLFPLRDDIWVGNECQKHVKSTRDERAKQDDHACIDFLLFFMIIYLFGLLLFEKWSENRENIGSIFLFLFNIEWNVQKCEHNLRAERKIEWNISDFSFDLLDWIFRIRNHRQVSIDFWFWLFAHYNKMNVIFSVFFLVGWLQHW